MKVETEQLSPDQVESVRDFYSACGYGGGAEPTDTIIVARDLNDIVGAIRLCEEHETWVTRGLYVGKGLRREGIGAILLEALVSQLGQRPCYALPYDHLEEFYGRFGFNPIQAAQLPPHLAQRLRFYQGIDPRITSVFRPGTQ